MTDDRFVTLARNLCVFAIVQALFILARACGAIDLPWSVVTAGLWMPSFVGVGAILICWSAHWIAGAIARRVSGR